MNEGNIAQTLLGEPDYRKKVRTVLELKRHVTNRGLKEHDFFFDKSIIFRSLMTKMFSDYSDVNVDQNKLITASLLCNCKKTNNARTIEKIRGYAKEGAEFLKNMFLFDDDFCRICEQLNRYSESEPRTIEGDILEVVDQFIGLLLSREDRPGFPVDKALTQLRSNLEKVKNVVLDKFTNFVQEMEHTLIKDNTESEILGKLVRLCENTYSKGMPNREASSKNEISLFETKEFFNTLQKGYLDRIDKIISTKKQKKISKAEVKQEKKTTENRKNYAKRAVRYIRNAGKSIRKIAEINNRAVNSSNKIESNLASENINFAMFGEGAFERATAFQLERKGLEDGLQGEER